MRLTREPTEPTKQFPAPCPICVHRCERLDFLIEHLVTHHRHCLGVVGAKADPTPFHPNRSFECCCEFVGDLDDTKAHLQRIGLGSKLREHFSEGILLHGILE